MQTRIALILLSGMSLFFSSSVFAHISASNGGWFGNLLHTLTGSHHLPMLVVAGLGIAYLVRKNRQSGR